jgi:hypothetical protein
LIIKTTDPKGKKGIRFFLYSQARSNKNQPQMGGGRYDLCIQQVLRNKIKGDRSKNGKNPQSYKILPQVTQS